MSGAWESCGLGSLEEDRIISGLRVAELLYPARMPEQQKKRKKKVWLCFWIFASLRDRRMTSGFPSIMLVTLRPLREEQSLFHP